MIVWAFLPFLSAETKPPREFDVLETDDGKKYHKCTVIRADPDSLVFRHRDGVARISFFDLSREIREAYEFDPFAAIKHFEKESDRQRAIRWQVFWDAERHKAALAERDEQEAIAEKAAHDWVPVEARVVQTFDDGFLARCKRITFVKTKKRSKLGFLVDGPPKRQLVDFGGGDLVVLRYATHPPAKRIRTNSTWRGYVNPASSGEYAYSYRGTRKSATSYQAVTRN